MSRNKNHQLSSSVPQIESRYLNVREAAAYLRATVWAMRTLAWEKRVPFAKIGKRIVFDRVDLDKFIEQQKQAAA